MTNPYIDPLYRTVILKNGTLDYKILINHPEVELYLPEVKRLIENPYYIVKDIVELEPGKRKVHETREEYFDLIESKTTSGLIVLKAVVDHVTDPGEIVTVFTSSKLRGLTTEGGIIYVRS